MPSYKNFNLFLALSSFICIPNAFAGTFLSETPQEVIERADGVIIGSIGFQEGIKDDEGRIWIRYTIKVEQSLLGNFPSSVWIYQLGGRYGKEIIYDSSTPVIGDWERILFIVREDTIGLRLINGMDSATVYGASPSARAESLKETAENSSKVAKDFSSYVPTQDALKSVGEEALSNSGSGPRRFQIQDRSKPLPVVYDDSLLPSGMTKAQARTAVENALAAWTAASSIEFNVIGTEEFSQHVSDINTNSGEILRIQLHDRFDRINDNATTLGIGGSSFLADLGGGGTVKTIEFNPSTRGYVYLEHKRSFFNNLKNFEEVLTHEIGHALGLSHSSESSFETDPLLKDAIMYFQARGGGRGADLQSWDIEAIRLGYPIDNQPPFSISQDVMAITSSGNFNSLQINRFEFAGGDFEGDTLSVEIVSQSSGNGTFTVNGNTVTYTTNFAFSDAGPISGFFDRIEYQLSDGQNKSPVSEIAIKGLRRDSGTDGLPDSWVADNFEVSDPNQGPFDDFDQDGLHNYAEFRANTDPKTADPIPAVVDLSTNFFEFSSGTHNAYVLEASPDLQNWFATGYTEAENEGSLFSLNSGFFYRVKKFY